MVGRSGGRAKGTSATTIAIPRATSVISYDYVSLTHYIGRFDSTNRVQGEMEEVGFYYSKGTVPQSHRRARPNHLNTDISDPAQLLETKKGAIDRFIGVLMPILDLYQLPLAKVHIYYDPAASTVTFNRDGSIFVNLRYYEGWRTYNFLRLCRLLIRI